MASINVLLLSTKPNIGGMERMVCGLARQFTRRGLSVRTVFPESPGAAELLQWCQDQGVDARVGPALLDAHAPHTNAAIRALRDYIGALRPDVVNLHYGDNTISLKDVVAARLAGVRRLYVTVHHPTPWAETTTRKRILTGIGGILSSGVIVPSTATLKIVRAAGVPRAHIHRIPNGLPAPLNRAGRSATRQRLGIADDTFVIGSLARLVPHKGIADLIDAASRLPDASRYLVLIAGDGPERGALEALAAERLGDRARFLGHVAATADLYAASDVFALPSHLEGFGLVYVEAAHYDIPSIGVNLSAVPEVITHGDTGLLVPPGDVAALTDALRQMQQDPARRTSMGRRARERAASEFAEELMASRYEGLFGSLALHASLATAS